ncbi:MAG: DNA replication/repair protein RecF [Alphaproteobacteria bacterium]|nr:DNA replication/repair protein RecF [Alphaproteobacteria bacterium]
MQLTGVTRLNLSLYRCYNDLRFICDTRSVVLTGPNGAGKTNILEALSFFSPGRGFRRAKLSEIVQQGQEGEAWAVSLQLATLYGPLDIGTGLDLDALKLGQEKRMMRVNAQALRGQAALSAYIKVIWLIPQMDRLFLDAASVRRKFLDRLVFSMDPLHVGRVVRYEHAMRERGHLLRNSSYDPQWLSVLETRMVTEGIAIAAARAQFLAVLREAIDRSQGIFPRAYLKLNGDVDDWLQAGSALEGEEKFLEILKTQRRKDAMRGRASQGPHRTDLEVRFADTNMPAGQCSTGEQKALLITLVMAAARIQATQGEGVTILLLDEVVAHLDQYRRHALYDEITQLGIQAWMTGTDQQIFKDFGDRAQFFHVENAHVTRER